MKPDDANGRLPPGERPFRVLIIAGSNRRQYDCPGIDSKARTLMFRMADRLPQDWEIDLEDLGNVYEPGADSELQRLRLDLDGALRLAVQLLREEQLRPSPT